MDYRTFNEWSLAGYKINKGSRAVWISNVPMFSREQVTYSPRRSNKPYYGYNYRGDYDMAHGRDDPWADEAYESAWGY
jgi:hypothetical protein